MERCRDRPRRWYRIAATCPWNRCGRWHHRPTEAVLPVFGDVDGETLRHGNSVAPIRYRMSSGLNFVEVNEVEVRLILALPIGAVLRKSGHRSRSDLDYCICSARLAYAAPSHTTFDRHCAAGGMRRDRRSRGTQTSHREPLNLSWSSPFKSPFTCGDFIGSGRSQSMH